MVFVQAGSVEMRGAAFDWTDRSWAVSAGNTALAATTVLAPDSALSAAAQAANAATLTSPAAAQSAVASAASATDARASKSRVDSAAEPPHPLATSAHLAGISLRSEAWRAIGHLWRGGRCPLQR